MPPRSKNPDLNIISCSKKKKKKIETSQNKIPETTGFSFRRRGSDGGNRKVTETTYSFLYWLYQDQFNVAYGDWGGHVICNR